jgi:subfamily B ATP-binding cassette protein MsbA
MDRSEILRRIRREARPYMPQLALALLLGVLAGLSNVVPPWAFGRLVNWLKDPRAYDAHALAVYSAETAARESGGLAQLWAQLGAWADLHLLYVSLGLIAAALIFGALATYFQTYLTAWCGQHLIARLRVRLFERVLRLPLGVFDRWRPGELVARFSSDLQIMTDAVSISLPQMVVAIVTFVSSLAYLIYLDWLLTLVLLLVAPLVSVIVSRFQNLISASTKRTQSRIADLSANLIEVLQGQRIVKAFGREDYEVKRFRNRNEDLFGAYLKNTQFINMQPLIVSPIMILAVVVIVWLSVREVLVGRLNQGLMFTYWLLLVNLVNPINRLAAFFGEISKAFVGAGRVFEILDLPIEQEDRPDSVALGDVRGRIGFEHVTFRYGPDEAPALNDIDAVVEAGEIVALVGPSGAGKTTLVNLVPRFYAPQSGRVVIDGQDIAAVKLADIRAAIAIVPQDPQLFRGSVFDNIRYGRLDATDEEVRAAAREANAEEFITQLPDGYQTEVGERGVRLSGGQRQRVAIARAIVRNPRILILDEATSALDSHSEALIEQALDRLLPGRTTLIIAHRLSTIRRANRIFYIENGRIVEKGRHDDLLARRGAYARLHATQFAGAAQTGAQ